MKKGWDFTFHLALTTLEGFLQHALFAGEVRNYTVTWCVHAYSIERRRHGLIFFIFLSLGKMERLFSRFTWLLMHVLMSAQLQIACYSFVIYDLFELWWLKDKASSTHASRRLSFYATLFKQSCSLFTLPQWNPYVIGIPKLFICNVVLTGFVGQ